METEMSKEKSFWKSLPRDLALEHKVTASDLCIKKQLERIVKLEAPLKVAGFKVEGMLAVGQELIRTHNRITYLESLIGLGDNNFEASCELLLSYETRIIDLDAKIKIVKVGNIEAVQYSDEDILTGKKRMDITPEIAYQMGVQAGILACGEVLSKL